MRSYRLLFLLLGLCLIPSCVGIPTPAPPPPERGAGSLTAVPSHRVRIDDPFWSPRLATTLTSTLNACLIQCEKTGRLQNFAVAAGLTKGQHQGNLYNDSDVYKILEGAAYALRFARNPEIEARVDRIIATIASSQSDDGYVNTYYKIKRPDQRWQNIAHGHELYCAGHLIEAGIAYRDATGKRQLLDVAIRFADYIDAEFGPQARRDPPGHQEIEIALLKLAEATGEVRYGKLARFFLAQRGRHDGRKSYGDYSQDHAPIHAQDRAVGHSVRAMYQACAATDVARQDRDPKLRRTLEALWRDIHDGKIYVTGGIGSVAGIEGFAPSYLLPNDTAYAETCAAIAIAMWDHRMLLLTGDMRYADGVERAIYNGMLSGVSLSGDRFFYRNPLGSHGDHRRQEWFSCACCPSNVVRFLPSIGGLIYAHNHDSIQVALYVGSEASIELATGPVRIRQTGDYLRDGSIEIAVDPAQPAEFTLSLRQPSWCTEGLQVKVNGSAYTGELSALGTRRLRRRWQAGDLVEVTLPMPVRRVHDDPRVVTNRGRVSLQRGPLVYCMEGIDNGGHCRDLAIPPDAELSIRHLPRTLGGITAIEGPARRRSADHPAADTRFRAIPYYAWSNRQACDMVTWMPESVELAAIPGQRHSLQQPDREIRATHCFHSDSLAALNDGKLPQNSADHSIARMTFWPHQGSQETLTYHFRKAREVHQVQVYWFDDGPRGGCRVPASWQLEYRDGETWQRVRPLAGERYATDQDQLLRLRFAPVRAREFRLEIQLQKGYSAGVLEWELR